MQKPHIAIIGGGPGGLTLARILHLSGVEATVFERERFSTVRPQGGSLDMHADTGQFAIACAGLTEEFNKIARYEDQESRIYDKHGALRFLDVAVEGKERPEVDRGHLRNMLLHSLPAEMVRWDHQLEQVHCLEDGRIELEFRDGERQAFDLVVGADGTWSRVRPQLSSAKPAYSGVTFVEFGIDAVDTRYPELAKLVGKGLMFALGDSKAIIGHRDANAHIGVYAAMRVPEDWAKSAGLDWSSSEAIRLSLARYFDGWSDELLQLILNSGEQGEHAAPRPIYALPVGHRWEHCPGITLLGDAAHVMSPFGGDGANLAMRDAAELALALANAVTKDGNWREAVAQSELAMFARSEAAAASAADAIQSVFAEDGVEHVVMAMESQRT